MIKAKLKFVGLFFLLTTNPIHAAEAPTAAPDESTHWEFRTAPYAFLAHWYTLDIAYKISEHWSIGPSVIRYDSPRFGNMFLPSYAGYAFGGNVAYYLDPKIKKKWTFGWYVSSHAYYEKYDSYVHARDGHTEHEGYRINLVPGYRIKYKMFYAMGGLGAELRSHNLVEYEYSRGLGRDIITRSVDNRIIPSFEIKLGVLVFLVHHV